MLMGGGDSRSDGREAHGYAPPAGDGGEFGGALHGFADVAKVVGGAGVDRDGSGFGGVKGRGSHDEERIGEPMAAVKYFVTQSKLRESGILSQGFVFSLQSGHGPPTPRPLRGSGPACTQG